MTKHKQHAFSGPDVCKLSACDVVQRLRSGDLSPSECLDAALTRISQVEPHINALPTLCEERARHSILRLEGLREANRYHPGWLAGLPISIKDLNAVSGVRTTYGTPGLKDHVPDASDPLVERLEARGAIVIGKSNTPEMGAGGNTFNDVFGATRNPWDIRKNAGGSSGGAAASLATGETWLAQGSDLAGSLRTPAAYCGVVGLRPSPGRAGGGPSDIAFNLDAVQGPMGRNVLDVALLLDAMAGFDRREPITIEAPRHAFHLAALEAEPPTRIAYAPDLDGFAPVEPQIDAIIRAGLAKLEHYGTTVELQCPDLSDLYRSYTVFRGLVWAALPGRLDAQIQQSYKSTLAQNIRFAQTLTVDDIVTAQVNRARLYQSVQTFLTDYDVLACPVVGLEPELVENEYPLEVNGEATTDYIDWLRFSFLSTTTGLPALSMPIGLTQSGMPVGVQLIGQPRGEAALLGVARHLEDVVDLSDRVPLDPR